MRLHPVAIADGPLRSSYGLHAPYALRTIVELKTTDGLTGISRTAGMGRCWRSNPCGTALSAWIRFNSPVYGWI